MLEVTKAEYVEGYKVHLYFNNGESGIVDLRNSLWGPVFEPLKDIDAFRRFGVSEVFHTLCWENGADFAPEYLHERLVEQAAATAASPRQ